MTKYIIILLITIVLFYAIRWFNFELFTSSYQYDVDAVKEQQKNLLADNPYAMYIDDDTKRKLFTTYVYGSLEEPHFENIIEKKGLSINTSPLFEQAPKWHNELLPTINQLNNIPNVPDVGYTNNTYCGSFGNICNATTDCCGGLQCLNNRCQQV